MSPVGWGGDGNVRWTGDSCTGSHTNKREDKTRIRQMSPHKLARSGRLQPSMQTRLTHCRKEIIAEEWETRPVGQEDHPEVGVDGDGCGEAACGRAVCTVPEGSQEVCKLSRDISLLH